MSKAESDWLSLSDVSISYGNNAAVEHLSLDVEQGESLALAGSNGAGKTSLLMAIAGVVLKGQRVGGAAFWRGTLLQWGDVAGHINAGIRLVPERDKVFSLLTVNENLQIGARRNGQRDISSGDVFTWFPRLGERRRTLAGNLSGGEQQMLAIAMSLLASPRLLLLDEPTLGLDILARRGFYDALVDDYMDETRTILITTHQVEEVENLLTDVIFIDKGHIVLDCSVEDIATRFAAVAVAADQIDAARAEGPFYERRTLGKTQLYFERPNLGRLATLGDVHTPSVSDLFVAKLSGGAP